MTDFGSDDLEQIRRLRNACFTYTALALVQTAAGEPMTDEESEEMIEALASVAWAGHDVIEMTRARAN